MPNLEPVPSSAPANGGAAAHDLFALTDEQILEIQPDAQDADVSATLAESASDSSSGTVAVSPDRAGGAATPGPFTAPEDVSALAELYPGGLSQAKTAAERARTLDEIDAAYFGGANSTPEQVSAARAQLAQRMMNENPAAFREMVFASLLALEAFSAASEGLNVAPALRAASAEVAARPQSQDAGLKPNPAVAQAGIYSGPAGRHEDFSRDGSDRAGERKTLTPEGVSYSASQTGTDAHAAYVVFERAANQELERNVGGAIERAIAQALPNLGKGDGEVSAGARSGVPLRERLVSSVRQDVESALKGDRQLGEQIAQILAAKRFDDATRAQVVRLIGDRAQQLVPGAARRVIGEWTSATLAAHGARSERSAAGSGRREVGPAIPAGPSGTTMQNRREIPRSADSTRNDRVAASRKAVDYRKLSDQQILDL